MDAETKQCNTCQQTLPTELFCRFFQKRDNKFRVENRCRFCKNKAGREIMRQKSQQKKIIVDEVPKEEEVVEETKRVLTPEQRAKKQIERENSRKHYLANKEAYLARSKKYKQENKDKINEHRREYLRKKLKENPTQRLTRNMKCLLLAKIKKTASSTAYLGTNVSLIKDWLEFNFTENMNWGNYGKYWQIDHTIAIKQFDLNDPTEVKLCFNWKNLMPLEKYNNLTKSTHLHPHRVFLLEMRLREYIKKNGIDENIDEYMILYSKKFKNLLPEYYFMQHDQIAGNS